MERCREELKTSYQKCKLEEANMIDLLSNLMNKQKHLLDKIDTFDSHAILENRGLMLETTHINYMLFNKLLSLNVELESCWTRLNTCASRGILDLYICNKELQSTNDFATENSEIVINNCQRSNQNEVSLDTQKDIVVEVESEKAELPAKEDVIPQDLEIVNQNEVQHDQKSNGDESIESSVEDPSGDEQFCNNQTKTDQSSSSRESENEQKSFEDFKNETQTSGDPVKPHEQPNGLEQIPTTQDKNNAHVSHIAGSSDITQILEQHKPKGRFDRKYDNIKTKIPDLSFFREEDSSSEYYSLPDRDGSYKSPAEKKEIKENVDVKSKTKKKSPTENYPVIKDHELPNANDICVITYVSDPKEFYIALVGDDIIISLNEQLKEYATSRDYRFISKLDAKLAMGEYCMAFSDEYETWNRAQIFNWQMTDPTNVQIQFTDFGEYATVPFYSLLPIPECFCFYPKQAIRCHLANSTPAYGNKEWTSDAITEFENLCFNNGEYQRFKVVSFSHDSDRNSLSIDVMAADGNDVTIRESMIISGHAEPDKAQRNEPETEPEEAQESDESNGESRRIMIEQIQAAKGLKGISDGDADDALEIFCNDLPETHATIADAMMGYNAQDDMRICRFTRRDGTCFKGSGCRLDHKQRRRDGVTVDEEEIFLPPDLNFIPQVNDKLDVVITNFKTPAVVYGQVKSEHNGYGTVMRDLFKAMNSKEAIKTFEKFTISPAIGEFVIAKNADDRWYRGRVLELNSPGWTKQPLVKIFFADVGDVTDVHLDCVRKMQRHLASYPIQAIQFGVSNIKVMSDLNWPQFKEFIQNQVNSRFTVTVTYAGSDFIDGIFTSASGKNLGQEMINRGFALPDLEDIHPLRSSNILID